MDVILQNKYVILETQKHTTSQTTVKHQSINLIILHVNSLTLLMTLFIEYWTWRVGEFGEGSSEHHLCQRQIQSVIRRSGDPLDQVWQKQCPKCPGKTLLGALSG